jgi:hypothetical protein
MHTKQRAIDNMPSEVPPKKQAGMQLGEQAGTGLLQMCVPALPQQSASLN